jgi:hypothetical protein
MVTDGDATRQANEGAAERGHTIPQTASARAPCLGDRDALPGPSSTLVLAHFRFFPHCARITQ